VFNGVVLKTLPVRDPHRLVVRTPTSQRVTGTQIIYKATLDALHDSQRVFSAWISAVFAGVAILLSCTGICAVLAFLVAPHARDRVRIAPGAAPRTVLAAVTRQGLSLAAAGVAIGIPCALVNRRFIRSDVARRVCDRSARDHRPVPRFHRGGCCGRNTPRVPRVRDRSNGSVATGLTGEAPRMVAGCR
jgi:hypothetical protein